MRSVAKRRLSSLGLRHRLLWRWLLQMRIPGGCDTINEEHGVAEEGQEHMPTGIAGRNPSHNGWPFGELAHSINHLQKSIN